MLVGVLGLLDFWTSDFGFGVSDFWIWVDVSLRLARWVWASFTLILEFGLGLLGLYFGFAAVWVFGFGCLGFDCLNVTFFGFGWFWVCCLV